MRVIKSRRMRWAGHVLHMGEMRNVYKISAGKPERTRPLGRPRCRWEGNMRTNLRELMWERVERIHLVQDRPDRMTEAFEVTMAAVIMDISGQKYTKSNILTDSLISGCLMKQRNYPLTK
jgi:hypothetical protein